jgi:hypothetical protein
VPAIEEIHMTRRSNMVDRQVRERPLLLSKYWVNQILLMNKEQTRRPARFHELECPYGAVGDRLWVREAWQIFKRAPAERRGYFELRPWLQPIPRKRPDSGFAIKYSADVFNEGPWRPSIHMPRWASRIELRITDTDKEPLQSITKSDAMKEGLPDVRHWRQHWIAGWDAVYAARGYPYASNPWVWVVSFRVESIVDNPFH